MPPVIAMPTPIVTPVPLILAVVSALMTTVPTVMPVAPNLRWGVTPRHMSSGNVHHTRRGWWGINHPRRWGRGINHTGWRAVIDRTRHPHLAVNREMADARMHRHRRLDHHRVGTTALHQAQTQHAEQGQRS